MLPGKGVENRMLDQWCDFLRSFFEKVSRSLNYHVCELHFFPSDVLDGPYGKTLSETAVPLIVGQKVKIRRILNVL